MISSLGSRVSLRFHRPNIQMQKTGAGGAYQGDATLPASDLGRSRTCSVEHCSGRQRHLQEWVLEKERSIPTDQTQLWKPWRAHLHRSFNQH